MDDNDGMIRNMDRLKSLSKLMSSDGGQMDTDKIINAITAAKSLGIIGGEAREKPVEAAEAPDYTACDDEPNENVRVIKAAIPFLDKEYQKNLFLAVKLMEMSREFDSGAMSLQCQSIREDSGEKQREAMLRAMRRQMTGENGRRLDVILKMMEARRLAEAVKNIN